MSHLDRQTTDWSWTKAGREKNEERESGARESSEVVLLLFYEATTTSNNNMGKKIFAARREVKHTTYSTTASFWKKHEPFTLQFARFGRSRLYLPNNNNKKLKKTL